MGKKRRKLVKRKYAHLQRNIHYVNPTPESPIEAPTTITLVQPPTIETTKVTQESVKVILESKPPEEKEITSEVIIKKPKATHKRRSTTTRKRRTTKTTAKKEKSLTIKED